MFFLSRWFGCSGTFRQADQRCGAERLSQSAKWQEPSSVFFSPGMRLRFSSVVPK
jgi:hypothetical protein